MNDERCDLLCVDTPKTEAIREGLPGDEGAWVAAVAVMAVWRCGGVAVRLALAALAIFFMIRFV